MFGVQQCCMLLFAHYHALFVVMHEVADYSQGLPLLHPQEQLQSTRLVPPQSMHVQGAQANINVCTAQLNCS
jgi:hypothetical protein